MIEGELIHRRVALYYYSVVHSKLYLQLRKSSLIRSRMTLYNYVKGYEGERQYFYPPNTEK